MAAMTFTEVRLARQYQKIAQALHRMTQEWRAMQRTLHAARLAGTARPTHAEDSHGRRNI